MKLTFLLTRSEECVKVTRTVDDQKPKFATTDTKLYIQIVTLSAQDNTKLLQQLQQVLKEQLTGTSISQNKQ